MTSLAKYSALYEEHMAQIQALSEKQEQEVADLLAENDQRLDALAPFAQADSVNQEVSKQLEAVEEQISDALSEINSQLLG
ncbi:MULTISPECIES: hypothetical protein [Pseudoalteromonas]|uniref:Uncharacterized protein n=2 Tax=Pseudoalteromonas TaxID=53246 RepID=V4HTV5_PSEL2|nr:MULTISPECIES: hypothetical protein [Pseudoalteromonas]ESP91324.1 hypothetical protein PL2TA16_00872 [Pseudoalteromonas luteoviolacea 2ta16]KZN39644.1 hypothetical protein N483_19180 [Pseudoalteromonas luteoviolacea NCIMB 1944]MBQ4839310.1 hypothetical protein [Pseudoalteromonas luteoviolacea]MCG7551010.1 hypothetical protein [Pseudoalteromonas sp. Of7M-16]MDK2598151.1 hypothetical protein [Pseudoalteromonas sp. P94(2023)]